MKEDFYVRGPIKRPLLFHENYTANSLKPRRGFIEIVPRTLLNGSAEKKSHSTTTFHCNPKQAVECGFMNRIYYLCANKYIKMKITFSHYISALLVAFLCSCSEYDKAGRTVKELPPIFPDYCNVSVPYNIAPLNFEIEGAHKVQVEVRDGKRLLMRKKGRGVIRFSEKEWHNMLLTNKGKSLTISVSAWMPQAPQGIRYSDFSVRIENDPIDPWIAYRLIPPGYELWNHMAICQRSLESFTEEKIVSNRQNDGGCVNCHSFCNYNPGQFMFHARGQNGGTVLLNRGKVSKIALDQMGPKKSGTYPMWHPSGRYIAFSSNDTRQSFYGYSRDKIEVYDLTSDLMVYDVEHNRVLTDPRFTTKENWETFPTFSPDGKWLYYCVAHAQNMPPAFDKLKYALCRVSFDERTGLLGPNVDTVYSSAKQGGSVSFPRISPDGKYLMYTWAGSATFPIHHKEADLHVIRLSDGCEMNTDALNSDEVDSYHSWSSNGRWVLFSSKRVDTRYTRLFIAHISSDGIFSKPFLLPQEKPSHNRERLYSYNIPEFIKGKVCLPKDGVSALFR